MAKTFEELKAENAAAEAAGLEQTETTIPEQVEEVEEDEVDLDDADDESEEVGEPKAEEALETWMQTESESDETVVPVSVLAKVRGKLKGTVREQGSEIEELKAEIERLKNPQQPTQQPQTNQTPPRPTLEQFDYDNEAYDAAIDEWQLKRFQAIQANEQQQSKVSQQQEAQLKQIEQATNSHYERAQKLVETGVISADAYNQADTAVRTAFEHVFPNQGDSVTDAVISQLNSLGDGSEKVMFHLGRNPTALNELKSRLTSDPTGMQAMAYLGTLHAKATLAPTKKVSQAPKPATQLRGEENTSSAATPLRKKYRAAHKSGNPQDAFNIKREARMKGFDTSSW